MDDKKKTVSEETKETSSMNSEVIDFDEMRGADKPDTDNEEKGSKNSDTVKEKTNSTDKNAVDEKQSDSKDLDDKKQSDTDNKKQSKTEDTDDKKQLKVKEVTDKKLSDNKETTDNNQPQAKVEVDKTKSEDKNASDSKESEIKSDSAKSSEMVEKQKDTTNNRAISQSKRLADVKAAQDMAANTAKQNEKTDKKSQKGLKIALVSIVAVIAVVYIAGFVYFSNYFYPNVIINGMDVSGMNTETAKSTLNQFYDNYALTLETIDGGQVTIVGDDISMEISLQDDFNNCINQQEAYLWFVNIFKNHEYSVAAESSWNEDTLNALYKKLSILDKDNMIAPVDAHIGVNDGKFAIIKEILGTTIKMNEFKKTVDDSLSNVIVSVNLEESGCYQLPSVYETDSALQSEFEAKSEYTNAVILLQLDDLTLEPGMELYNAVLEKKGESYTVSKSLVVSYVKDLAKQYDTLGKDRTFTTSFNDRQVKVNGTAFGYEMDQKATVEALYNALTKKESTTVDVVFTKKGYTLQGENDIGDTYIEVNLSEQYVVAYKDGKKVAEGDCVSGKESTGDGTCLGLYAIQDKLSPTVLRGQKKPVTKTVTKKNKKGKKVKVTETTYEYEYESPVTFWMQFNGGYGLHDAAQWRSAYGGSIYYYSGSHGCVNLPYDLAEKLYENFGIGDPVVVYFYDNENRE